MTAPIRITTLDEAIALTNRLIDNDPSLRSQMTSKAEFQNALARKFKLDDNGNIAIASQQEIESLDSIAIKNFSSILACIYLFYYHARDLESFKDRPEKLKADGKSYLNALTRLRSYAETTKRTADSDRSFQERVENKYYMRNSNDKIATAKNTLAVTNRKIAEEERTRIINLVISITVSALAGAGVAGALAVSVPILFPVVATAAVLSVTFWAVVGPSMIAGWLVSLGIAKIGFANLNYNDEKISNLKMKKRRLESYIRSSADSVKDTQLLCDKFLEASKNELDNAKSLVETIKPPVGAQPEAQSRLEEPKTSSQGMYARQSSPNPSVASEPVEPGNSAKPGKKQ